MLLLLACVDSPAPVKSPSDTGEPDTDTPVDTSDSAGPCETDPSDDHPTSFPGLVARLEAQHCLAEADQDALIAYIDAFFATQDIWCDAVWRVTSDDGVYFSGTPELVREHASVPDVRIEGDTHIVVYNDLTPGLFEQTLREDPERFWRQGLIGMGGLGVSRNDGGSFADGTLDLGLPELRLVIDPDLGTGGRLVSFQIAADTLDGSTWDPAQTPAPHNFYRSVSTDTATWPTPELVVASETGMAGGFDPTVLDVPDGEILYVGDFVAPMMGWTAPDAVYPALGTFPDVVTQLRAAAPDMIVDSDGSYRIYAYDPDTSVVFLGTSTDGRAWLPLGPAVDSALGSVHNPSIARDDDGTWWLYYTQRIAACMEKAGE